MAVTRRPVGITIGLIVVAILIAAILMNATRQYRDLPRDLGRTMADTRMWAASGTVALGCIALLFRIKASPSSWRRLAATVFALAAMIFASVAYVLQRDLDEAHLLAQQAHKVSCLECFESCKGLDEDCRNFCNDDEHCVGER